MSVQAITAAFAVQGVSPSEKLTLLALANYADQDGRCWPSQVTLTRDTGLSERTIWAAMQRLEAAGMISRERRRRSDGYRTSDLVTIFLPATDAVKPNLTRKSCNSYPQMAQTLPATVAAQEPSVNHQEEPADAVGRERESDWPEGDPAKVLISEIASPWLDPHKTAGLVTTAGRVSAWRREGASWQDDVIPVIAGICQRRKAPVSSWQFFDAAIAQSIANNRAGLTIPEARAGPESITDRMEAERVEARRMAFARMDAQHG
ncbi:MAG: helix-turn-helix domain-containing protein [Minisyncoccia bacterium]